MQKKLSLEFGSNGQEDDFSFLPQELKIMILSYLSIPELITVCQVSKSFLELAYIALTERANYLFVKPVTSHFEYCTMLR